MPEISRFYGIIIRMFHDDHNPPHFHAEYGEYNGVIRIEPTQMLAGNLPSHARRLVIEWGAARREELLADWALARAEEPLRRIAPLE